MTTQEAVGNSLSESPPDYCFATGYRTSSVSGRSRGHPVTLGPGVVPSCLFGAPSSCLHPCFLVLPQASSEVKIRAPKTRVDGREGRQMPGRGTTSGSHNNLSPAHWAYHLDVAKDMEMHADAGYLHANGSGHLATSLTIRGPLTVCVGGWGRRGSYHL